MRKWVLSVVVLVVGLVFSLNGFAQDNKPAAATPSVKSESTTTPEKKLATTKKTTKKKKVTKRKKAKKVAAPEGQPAATK